MFQLQRLCCSELFSGKDFGGSHNLCENEVPPLSSRKWGTQWKPHGVTNKYLKYIFLPWMRIWNVTDIPLIGQSFMLYVWVWWKPRVCLHIVIEYWT